MRSGYNQKRKTPDPSHSQLILAHASTKREENKRAKTTVEEEGAEQPEPQYWLKVNPQPPEYPFVNVYFNVRVFFIDGNNSMKKANDLPLYIEVLYDDGELCPNQNVLELSQETVCSFNSTGSVLLNLRLKDLSMNHERRGFRIRFSCPNDRTEYGLIQPVVTESMFVVRHRVRIFLQPPQVWYKDEGGRDKCIDIKGLLEDNNDLPITNREVPLRVTLVYEEDHNEVKDQSILTVNHGMPPKVDSKGQIHLRIRIDQVSKNHRGQPFCIRVEPDFEYCPTTCDISSIVTNPILVKSKKAKKKKVAPRQIPAPTRSGGQPPPILPPHTKSRPATMPKIGRILTNPTSLPEHNVQAWICYTVQGLRAMEWQLAGYEIFDDGSPNFARPLYRCPFCFVYKDITKGASHDPGCMIYTALSTYYQHVENDCKTISSQDAQSPYRTRSKTRLPLPTPISVNALSGPSMGVTTQPSALSPGMNGISGRTSQSVGGVNIRGRSLSSLIAAGTANTDTSMAMSSGPSLPNFSSQMAQAPTTMPVPATISNPHEQAIRLPPVTPILKGEIGEPPMTVGGVGIIGSSSMDTTSDGYGDLPKPPLTGQVSINPHLPLPPHPTIPIPALQPTVSVPMSWQTANPTASSLDLTSPGVVTANTVQVVSLELQDDSNFVEESIDVIMSIRKEPWGFPAFNGVAHCVGFYKYDETNAPSFLRFVPTPVQGLDPNSLQEIIQEFKKRQANDKPQTGSKSVLIRRDHCIVLDRMKEKALLRHFDHQANDMESNGNFLKF